MSNARRTIRYILHIHSCNGVWGVADLTSYFASHCGGNVPTRTQDIFFENVLSVISLGSPFSLIYQAIIKNAQKNFKKNYRKSLFKAIVTLKRMYPTSMTFLRHQTLVKYSPFQTFLGLETLEIRLIVPMYYSLQYIFYEIDYDNQDIM